MRTLVCRIAPALLILNGAVVQYAFGQEAVGPPPQNPPATETLPAASVEPSPLEATETSEARAASSIVDLNARPVAETPRRVHYTFQLAVRGAYDDNINLGQIHQTSDYYVSIEPRFSFGLGGTGDDQTNYLSFVYGADGYLFADHTNANALQHLIRLAAQRQFSRLTFSVNEDIQILDSNSLTSLDDSVGRSANIDVNQRTRENIFNTQANVSYDLSSKTSLSGSVSYQVYDYATFLSSETFSTSLFFNYNYGAKVVFGIGGTGGYDYSEGLTPEQYFEQANLRMSYQASGKISFSGTVGMEFRQFASDAFGQSRGEYISPVYNLSGSYQPFDGTSISISGARQTRNSAVTSGGDFSNTNIDLSIRQRFTARASIGVSIGYENDSYFSALRGIDVSRTDDYYYVQTSIDVNVTRFWSAGVYYLHRQDSSSLDLFSFSDNQIGVRTSVSF